jgi:ribosomal protein S12 methylthiotransferase
MMQRMGAVPQVMPWLHIPVQSGHDAVLKRMKRTYTVAQYDEVVGWARRHVPGVEITSDFIVGFPGETDEEFAGLETFLETIDFDRVGVFQFSPEPDTPAGGMPGQVPDAVKQVRYERLMAAQQAISLRRNQAQVGRTLDVLVEGSGELTGQKGPVVLARSYRDAPEVDGLVIAPGIATAGEMRRVRITGAMAYDLMGELVPEGVQEPVYLTTR